MFKIICKNILSILTMCILIAVCVYAATTTRKAHYNCSLSEFHPDYSKEIRKRCRAARSEK